MLGYHVGKFRKGPNKESLAASIVSSIESAKDLDMNIGCTQIFVMGPANRHVNVDTNDIHKLKEISDSNIHIYVHSAYITANIYIDETSGYGAGLSKTQMQICEDINAAGIVVHLPRADPCVAAKGFNIVNRYRQRVPIFMEIEVAKPPKITYDTPEKLTLLCDELRKVSPDFGICIDTAHLWSCGTDVSSYDQATSWLSGYDLIDPPPKTLFHLNDSSRDLGSGIDTHAGLCLGNIWKDYRNDFTESGAYKFIEWAKEKSVDIILERDDKGLINDFNIFREHKLYKN